MIGLLETALAILIGGAAALAAHASGREWWTGGTDGAFAIGLVIAVAARMLIGMLNDDR